MTKTKMGKNSKYMNLQLLDEEGIKLNCTLWDEYYDEMFGYIQSHKEEVHVVLLVQFGSFNKYKGKTTLSNAFHITRLFINADIEEIRSFRTKFVEKICKISSNGQKSIGSSGSISVADDFLVKHPFSNFRDITLLDKPCEVIVLGTIMGVDDKDDWYYLGCEECTRKVETTMVIEDAEDGAEEPKFKQVLVCSNQDCPKEVVAATPIFRIPIRVQDYVAIASLTLFDREARKMFGMTAIQLLEKCKVDQASLQEKTIPYQFKSLNDKKFAFKIQISRFNIDNHIDGYAVHKLVNDATIIESLESRKPADQGVDEASADVSLSDISTQNPFALKDAVDSIGDNFTPDCTSKDCSKTSSSELKRNLADVYEVEETTSLSSTKVKKAGVSDVQVDD
ncbi:putative nucleic acid-binding, replication factor A [Helianthus annuus]|nr:putative nucleic acid-binding, replication factor A [Helianthus annuus]